MELGVGEFVGVGTGAFADMLAAMPESGAAGSGMRIDVGDNDVDFERVRLATAAAAFSASKTCRSSRCRSRCKTAIARNWDTVTPGAYYDKRTGH